MERQIPGLHVTYKHIWYLFTQSCGICFTYAKIVQTKERWRRVICLPGYQYNGHFVTVVVVFKCSGSQLVSTTNN